MQHSIGGLVPGERLFGQVLVRLCQTFHLCEASVERHGRVAGLLRHIQVSRPPQLLLYHQCLLQQLQRRLDMINTLVLKYCRLTEIFLPIETQIALKRRAKNLFFISR